MAARAAICPGPGGRRLQARALRRRRRRRPQSWPLCGSAVAAPSLSRSRLCVPLARPSTGARLSQPALTRPARAPPVPARVSASPPLGSAPPSARPGATAAAPPVRSARPGRFPAPQPAASAAAAGRVLSPAAAACWAGRAADHRPGGPRARAGHRRGRRTPEARRQEGPLHSELEARRAAAARRPPGRPRLGRSPTQRCPTPAAGTKEGATGWACAAAGENPRGNLEGRGRAKDQDASHPRPHSSRTKTRARPSQD